jgi:DNA-binding beta-propeller fold protein YncE
MMREDGQRLALSLFACISLVSCSEEVKLTLFGQGQGVTVGQTVIVKLLNGGDGSDLDEKSVKLTDSAHTSYPASSEIAPQKISAKEVHFFVPTGIAPGQATIEVGTKRGPAFSGNIVVNRLVAVRDRSGKVWFLSIFEEGQVAQFAEIKAELIASELGTLSISPSGRLVAVSSKKAKEVRLATLEPNSQVSKPIVLTEEVADLAFTATEDVLVVTERGAFRIERPKSIDNNTFLTASPIGGGAAFAIAVDPTTGKKAAALGPVSGGGKYQVIPLDLDQTPPALPGIALPWVYDPQAVLDLAMTPDGSSVLVVNSKSDRLALVKLSDGTIVERDLPAGQSGPTRIAGNRSGKLFYVANQTSRNVSVVTLKDNDILITASAVDPGFTTESGSVVDVAMSDHDEAIVLTEHDVFILWAGNKAARIQLPFLFLDKTNGEVGVSVAVQP